MYNESVQAVIKTRKDGALFSENKHAVYEDYARVICFIGTWNKLGKNLEYEETTAEIIPKPVKIFRNKIKIPISGFLLHSLNKDAILDLEEKESNYHWLKAVEGDSHGKKRRISKSVTHMAG